MKVKNTYNISTYIRSKSATYNNISKNEKENKKNEIYIVHPNNNKSSTIMSLSKDSTFPFPPLTFIRNNTNKKRIASYNNSIQDLSTNEFKNQIQPNTNTSVQKRKTCDISSLSKKSITKSFII